MADGKVLIDTKLDTSKLNGQVSKLKRNLSAGLASVAKVGAAALGAATAAVTAFTVSAVKDFVTFEDKMNEVFTLVPGASDEMKSSMIADVKEVAKEMGVLPEDVIPAVYQALSAGVPTDNVFSFVETATKLAKAGVAELDDSVGVLSTVVNNYADMGLTAEEASNMLFTTVKNGVTSIPELSTKLGDVVPIASALGVNFAEVSASMATMTYTMGAGSTNKAVTNLRGMLNELGKEGSQADKAFQDIAGIGFAKFIEGGGTMQEAMEVLRQASVKNDTAINNLFGSIEAGQAALILAGNGADKFRDNLEVMATSAGATDEAFETMAGGAQFAIDRIMANIDVLKLNFAEQFAPAFDTLLTSIVGLLEGTEGATKQFTEAVSGILNQIITKAMEILPNIIKIGANIVISLAKGILNGLPSLITELAYLVGFMIGYLVERLPEFLQQGLEVVSNIASGIVAGIPNVLTRIGELLSAAVAWIMENAPQLIGSGLELILNLLKGIVDNIPQIVDAIKGMLGSLISTIIENGPEFLEKGKETLTNFWNGLEEIFGPVVSSIGNLMMDIIKAIGDKAVDIFNSAKDLGKNLIDGFVQGFENLKEAAKQKITGFFDGVVGSVKGLLGIASPSKVFKEIGSNTAQGFEDGLEDGKAGVMRTADSIGYETIEAVEAYQPQAVQAGTDLGDGVKDGIESTKGSIRDQWNDILNGLNERTKTIVEQMKASLTSTLASFSAIGEALYNGELGWQDFAKIGLNALADILSAIGYQLAAMAALEAVKFNWTGAALATTGSAAAFVASGLIDAWAASYDVGGIIKQDQLANIHKGETILPAGITADMRSAGLEIRPLGGQARDIVVNGVLEVDGRRLAKAVFRYTDDNVGLSYI